MKTFFLIIAICATVAVACPDAKLNKEFAKCFDKAQWTIEQYTEFCTYPGPDPDDTEKGDQFIDLLSCIYTKAGILKKESFGKNIIVHPSKATKLVEKSEADDVKQHFKGCESHNVENPTFYKVTNYLYFCLSQSWNIKFKMTCLSTVEGVLLKAKEI